MDGPKVYRIVVSSNSLLIRKSTFGQNVTVNKDEKFPS